MRRLHYWYVVAMACGYLDHVWGDESFAPLHPKSFYHQLFAADFFERRIIKKIRAFMHHVQVAVSQSMELPANTEGLWIKLPSFFHSPWPNWSDACALRSSQNFLACHHMKNNYSHSEPGSMLQLGQNMLFVPKKMIQDVPALLHMNTINTNQLPSALREVQRANGVFIGHSYFEHSWIWIFNLLLLQCWMWLHVFIS